MAYFSGSGATIRSGAAGLGEYFDAAQGAAPPAPVQAFQDGVFGGGSADVWMSDVGDDPGPLRSYHDGSLGACHGCGMGAYDQAAAGLGMPLWIDGKPVDQPVTIMHAPSPMGGSLHAYRDGSLGEYFGGGGVPWTGAYRDGSLGAVGDSSTLNMTDAATLKEVKSALGLAMPEVSMASGSPYDQAYYESPLWEPSAGDLWSKFTEMAAKVSKGAYTAESLTNSGKVPYPNAVGIGALLALGVGSPGYGTDPTYFPKNFPILAAYQKAMIAAGSPKGFTVSAPFFTVQEKVSGKSMFAGVSKTSLILGLGAVAAVGAFFAFRKR